MDGTCSSIKGLKLQGCIITVRATSCLVDHYDSLHNCLTYPSIAFLGETCTPRALKTEATCYPTQSPKSESSLKRTVAQEAIYGVKAFLKCRLILALM
jgi:hypothetical protein